MQRENVEGANVEEGDEVVRILPFTDTDAQQIDEMDRWMGGSAKEQLFRDRLEHLEHHHRLHSGPKPDSLGALLVKLGLLDESHPSFQRPPCHSHGFEHGSQHAAKIYDSPPFLPVSRQTEPVRGFAKHEHGGPDKVAGVLEQFAKFRGRIHAAHEHDRAEALRSSGSSTGSGRDEARPVWSRVQHIPLPNGRFETIKLPFHAESDSNKGERGYNHLAYHHHHHGHSHAHGHYHSHHGYHAHPHSAFLIRLRRALLALKPAEAVLMTFIVGMGLGAVLHAVGVVVCLALAKAGWVVRPGGRAGRRGRCGRRGQYGRGCRRGNVQGHSDNAGAGIGDERVQVEVEVDVQDEKKALGDEVGVGMQEEEALPLYEPTTASDEPRACSEIP